MDHRHDDDRDYRVFTNTGPESETPAARDDSFFRVHMLAYSCTMKSLDASIFMNENPSGPAAVRGGIADLADDRLYAKRCT